MGDFCMPALGADMEAGTLVEWHVQAGAHVKRGDIVALVETQKGLVEVEIWESGVVERILVQPGAKVPVGVVLAKLRPDASAGSIETSAPPSAVAAPVPSAVAAPVPSAVAAPVPSAPRIEALAPLGAGGNGAGRVRASPAARQLAREHDINLMTLHGTGPHGAVTRTDVARAVGEPPSALVGAPVPLETPVRWEPPPPIDNVPAALESGPAAAASAAASGAMRKAIAAAMGRSKREIPHYYLSQEIEVGHAVRWLEERNAACPVEDRIVFAALLLKATALALREVPELNGHFVDGEYREAAAVHVGVAISLRHGGLVAPAIRDTDKRPLAELMTALVDVVARARAGSLRSSEMSDPTVTVTNLGDQGADAVFGVIFPPQVAIIGFGTLRERPWAENGLLGVRPVVTATLSADHRASDGHRGARFLAAVARHLEKPEELE